MTADLREYVSKLKKSKEIKIIKKRFHQNLKSQESQQKPMALLPYYLKISNKIISI